MNARDNRPVEHLGVTGLAARLGVTRHAVSKWRARHPAGSSYPFPEPDVTVDGVPGWLPTRVSEVERWRDKLPGRTGRPRTVVV